ncbi:hypothetical protein [Aureimonas ureilytica]|uniref:hypothetical protein n=1 Tax=Aureimonas ureilytica TaxID=401562 RepID=UPI000362BCB3|nr:hypothetical protein [Aureimonas ureilytica]
MVGFAERYAETFPREGGALHSQWTSFAFQLAHALTTLTGQGWEPDHPEEAHSASHYASYSLVRSDGFRLRISKHGSQGVASMDTPRPRSHVVLDRSAPLPFRKRPALHAFDQSKPVADIAAEILAQVVARAEPDFQRQLDMQNRRAETADRLAKASAALAEVAGPCVSDPRDNDGRSHLLQDGAVFGRIRLSRGGSSSLELNGLDHETVIAIAALIKSRQEAAA